jgi:hypothetical protein
MVVGLSSATRTAIQKRQRFKTGMWEATVIPSANGDALKVYGGGRESAPQDDYPHPYQNPRLCVRDYSVGHHGSPGAFWTPIPRAIRVDEPAGLDKTERHVGRTNRHP